MLRKQPGAISRLSLIGETEGGPCWRVNLLAKRSALHFAQDGFDVQGAHDLTGRIVREGLAERRHLDLRGHPYPYLVGIPTGGIHGDFKRVRTQVLEGPVSVA